MRKFLSALGAVAVLVTSGMALGLYSPKSAMAGGGGAAAAEGALSFVELDQLVFPIIDGNGVNQTVSLVIALEMADSEAAAEVITLQPRLKDAFIQEMYGALNRHAALKGGVIQVGKIKARLSHVAKKVLGQDKVKDVLLQVVQQRPV